MKPGGRIVVVDFKEGKLPVGPPPSMKISERDLLGEFAAVGLRVSRRHDLLPHQYFGANEKLPAPARQKLTISSASR